MNKVLPLEKSGQFEEKIWRYHGLQAHPQRYVDIVPSLERLVLLV